MMPRHLWCAVMSSYRYCFLDSADCIAEFHVIEGNSDGQAQILADRLLAAFGYPCIEVWDRGRGVYCARKIDGAVPMSSFGA
jgi:hypothetical protein